MYASSAWVTSRMLVWRAIRDPPHDEPDEPNRARRDEGPFPSPRQRDDGNNQRRQQRTDVGAGVEDAGRKRPLFAREPFGNCLNRAGKVAGLSKAQRKSSAHEAGDRCTVGESEHREHRSHAAPKKQDPCVRHRRDAPHNDSNRKAHARAQAIHEPPGEEEPDGVGKLKREDDVAVIELAPAELLLQRRLENADDLTIDVVDDRRKKEQPAHIPSVVANLGRGGDSGCDGGLRGGRGLNAHALSLFKRALSPRLATDLRLPTFDFVTDDHYRPSQPPSTTRTWPLT